jgi:hypothetical protein
MKKGYLLGERLVSGWHFTGCARHIATLTMVTGCTLVAVQRNLAAIASMIRCPSLIRHPSTSGYQNTVCHDEQRE